MNRKKRKKGSGPFFERVTHSYKKKGPDPFSFPAAAEGSDERDRGLVARGAHLQRLAPVAQLAPLRVEQLELAYVACAVACVGKRSRAARRGHRARLCLRLLGEQTQRRKLVLDVPEGDQHLLAVGRHGALEVGVRA